jgi:hypothetical protein
MSITENNPNGDVYRTATPAAGLETRIEELGRDIDRQSVCGSIKEEPAFIPAFMLD